MDDATHPAATAPAPPAIVPPKALAEAAGISGAYASMILTGKRPCSSDIALVAFRAFGVRLGLLADMTDGDIDKLCSCRKDAPGDARLSARECSAFSNRAGGAYPVAAADGAGASYAILNDAASFRYSFALPALAIPVWQAGQKGGVSLCTLPSVAGPYLGRTGAVLPAGGGEASLSFSRQEGIAHAQ